MISPFVNHGGCRVGSRSEMGKRETGATEVGGCSSSTGRFSGGLGQSINGSRRVQELAMR